MCLRILLSGFLFVSVLASSYALQSPLELDDLVSMSGLPQGISFIRPLDVDEDGDADIVLIGEYSNDVFWYENDGLGQFGPLTTLVTLLPGVAESAECSDVVLFDHGANGTRDLVVSENLTGRVVRFPRTGPAAFGPPVPVIQSSGRLGQLKALDVDGDGDEDLVIAGDLGSPGTWVMATANGGFLPPMRIGGGGRLVEPFDFEGDGDVDFFVSGFTIASLFLRNDGVGAGFTSRPLASTFTDADIAAGDVNGDGFADAIISRRSQTVAEIHLANAAGEFALTQGILGFHTFSPSVDLLDVDGDLDLDIVLPGPQNLNPVVLWAENLGGSFDSTASTLIPSEGNSEFLAVADFNGDSLPDFVGGGPPSRVQIALSDASGALSTMAPISDGWENLSGAVVLDADGDTDADLAVYSTQRGLGIAFNSGTGELTVPEAINGFAHSASPGISAAHAADVDEDGRDDLLSVTVTGQLLYSRQSTGGFDAPITLGFAAQEEPRVTDVDRDGLLDVIAYRTGPPRLVAFLQTSAGFSAVPVPVMDISGTPRTYEFLDVDLDGFTDLVAYEISGTFGTNRMVAYYGLAAGGFGPAVDLPLPTFGGTPSGLQVFDDLDGDGLVDLIYTRGQNDGATAWWTQNLGGRQFAPAAILGVIGENIRRIDLGEPVPGGPKSLLATTRTLGSFERYRAFEVLPNNTLGGAVQVEPIGIGATEAFFVDLGTGAQDVVIIDGILSRIGVAYNLAQRDVGMSFCGPAVPNSTGLPGEMSAIGSRVASRNALDLVASQLPPGATAFFLGSLTPGFVANPGGSSGNLCLGGDVGRLSQPGLVGPAGPDGVFRRRVDLTLMPQPQGPVTVLAQSTWYFQAWHRDALPGLPPTSNFTDGVEIEFD